MKYVTLIAMSMALVLGTVAFVSAQAGAKPVKGVIVGEVIDIATYAMKGQRGEDARAAGIRNSSKNFPVGILEEETGDIYIALYRNPVPAASMGLANPMLSEFMNKKVVVQGLLYKAQGINVIRVSVVGEY